MTSSTGQYSTLPPVMHHITTNDADGTAKLHASGPSQWRRVNPRFVQSVLYSTSTSPPCLNNNDDIATHERPMASGTLGIVQPNGTVCNVVDIGPSTSTDKPYLHRTQSLDYGVVLVGELELTLDSGETRLLRAGDVIVQRATMHAWRNTSATEWARVFYVIIGCEKVVVGDKEFPQDMGKGVPPAAGTEEAESKSGTSSL